MASTPRRLDFKKLIVWQRARALTVDCFRCSMQFPRFERQVLAHQICSAALSIAANIAEAEGRRGIRDQCRILRFSMGSARELESHLEIAADLGVLSTTDRARLIATLDQTERLLAGLLKFKRNKAQPGEQL